MKWFIGSLKSNNPRVMKPNQGRKKSTMASLKWFKIQVRIVVIGNQLLCKLKLTRVEKHQKIITKFKFPTNF